YMSFENFWVYTEQANAEHMDIGFELYSKGHLIWLLVLAVASLIMVPAYLRSSEHKQSKIRKIFAMFLLISEIIKDIIIVIIGAPISAYLPLHLCGYAIFFVLMDAFMPKQKVTGQLIAYAFGPGALAALLFCSWTMLPLFWNFMTIHSFIFHWAIVTYLIMRLADGEIRPDYKGLWISVLTMALLAVPAYLVDMKTGYNYMFIYEVQRNSPLEIAWEIFGTRFGKPGYVVGAMLLVMVIFHALYLIYGILGFRRRKR
ncbi:MAG: YwaF family protein, partial [Firmicutes bacterium]|nr:YwaF family protein [Bacillota bacterium]